MNDQAIRFRLGIFVLAALILLAVLLTLFGGFPNYFKKSDSYTVVFPSAQGLSPGTPVRRSGVKIGEVSKLVLDNATGKVHVSIQIEKGFTLRKADKPTLIQGFLAGDTSVSFLPPPPDEKQVDPAALQPGAVVDGVVQTDIQAVVQKTGDLMPPAQEVLIEMKKVFERVDKLAPLMEDTMKEFKKTNEEIQVTARSWTKVGERTDVLLATNEEKISKSIARMEETLKRVGDLFSDENQKMVRDTLKNVKSGSDRLDGIAKGTEEMIRDLQKTLKRTTESLDKADEVLSNMAKATKPFGERSPAILKNIDESTDKLNKILTDLRELNQLFARGDGTIQKLLSDPAVYNNLNDASLMVVRILPRVDRALRDLEIFADKIARHPEALGIGGVIRPGSGLKESPSTILPWRYPNH